LAAATPTIEVVAPADLPEDYEFDAQVGDRIFSVKVPRGGVEEGQKFSVTLPGGSDAVSDSMCTPRVSIPTGAWRDGLCDCFRHGCIHPVIFNAVFCPLIATAQVMTRMGLTMWGVSGQVFETSQTFKKILFIVVLLVSIDRILAAMMFTQYKRIDFNYSFADARHAYQTIEFIKNCLSFVLAVYTIYAITKTRKFVRNKYAIPEKVCKGWEDFCCALWLPCCAVTQMARHTADYNTYRGVCCTDTGLPEHVPAIV